ncbi:NAD(P)H-hydrate dehydratase, partial [Actinotalea sp. C106]|uniref:bifunctional ADP-dependent NAD(P)H-hydrate dehydratase/NAD(P)H-hydrate epimerase n=1 Tax=Actinotalea sp. C106 TaxID=2908644 RepID=UPI002541E252
QALRGDVVLDGLLGMGGRGGLRGAAAELVAGLDELCRDVDPQGQGPGTDAGRPRVIAVDVPSGIGVEDGGVPGPVLRADRTVCFGAVKAGLLLPPATALVGRLEVVDLGLEAVLADQVSRGPVQRLEVEDVRRLWPVPGGSDHKYSRGVVGVVAGTSTYPGAAVLTVAGAQGAGCGMVRYVGPEAVASAVVTAHPEVVAATTAEVHVQAWVLGPGLSCEDEQSGRARAALAQALEQRLPVVVDAGGLALLPERLDPLVVLTPHAGELAALLVARGVEVG